MNSSIVTTRKRVLRKRVLWLVVGLYLICLCLPAFTFDKYPPAFGAEVLRLGWLGFFDLDFAWYANPLFVITLWLFSKGAFMSSSTMGIATLSLALTSFNTKNWWVNDVVGSYPIMGHGLGFYMWLLSFIVLLVCSFILLRLEYIDHLPERWH